MRLALGARPVAILAPDPASVPRPGVVGVALGLTAAALLAPLIASQLFGVRTHDLSTFLIVPTALLLVATLAALSPALGAMRVNAIVAIRAIERGLTKPQTLVFRISFSAPLLLWAVLHDISFQRDRLFPCTNHRPDRQHRHRRRCTRGVSGEQSSGRGQIDRAALASLVAELRADERRDLNGVFVAIDAPTSPDPSLPPPPHPLPSPPSLPSPPLPPSLPSAIGTPMRTATCGM